MPELVYEPTDWYWIVGGDTDRVYSSASGAYVPTTDPTYVGWLDAGGSPTRIASAAELGGVLAPYLARPQDADVLDGYKEAHAREITLRVVAKILLWLVNEVRGLKGQQAINAGQFRAFIKDQM